MAVAYLARGATKLLTLGKGDVLVVDMGDASVKAGRTDPQELLHYLAAGVSVFSVENLHAKVFVFGKTVIVGSSNVSTHSRDRLVEAGLEIANPKLRTRVTKWIKSIALAPVTPGLAKAKLRIYNAPKWGSGGKAGGKKRGNRSTATVGRLWVINTQPRKQTTQDEEDKLEDQAAHAKPLVANPSAFDIESIRYSRSSRFANQARLGQIVIVVHSYGNTIDVYPPARVLSARKYVSGGAKRIGVHIERRSSDEPHYWGAFRKKAALHGVKAGKYSEKEIRNPAAQQGLLDFFR